MTINAFLLEPIKKLSSYYDVYIAINGRSEDISAYLDNVTILTVPIERKVAPFHDLIALFHLIKIFRQYKFRGVHSVTPKAGLLAMIAAFFSRVPRRVHIFTGQVWVTRTGLSRWVLKLMDRIISKLATNILVDSASQRQFLLNEDVVNLAKSSVLAQGSISGVDTVRFKPNENIRLKMRQQFSIKNEETVYLFIGRLNRDKGVLDLASAFASLPVVNSHLLIVGPDEGDIRLEMESLLSNCIERVTFVGFSNQPEDYMAAADILCLPSYREGFGSVIIEAAAVGLPAIGSKIYGVEDAIAEEQTGLLFDAGNREELITCMMRISTDKGLCKRLGTNARKRALEDFSSERLASAWLNYYKTNL